MYTDFEYNSILHMKKELSTHLYEQFEYQLVKILEPLPSNFMNDVSTK